MHVGEVTRKETSRWVGLAWEKGGVVSRINLKICCVLLVEPKLNALGTDTRS